MSKYVAQNINDSLVSKWSNNFQYFEGLLQNDFGFRITSYQICKNWLKAREGIILSDEDSQQYKRIVGILNEIVKLTEEIKTTIQCYHLKEMEIFEKVRAIVVRKLKIQPKAVTHTANFICDLGADSLCTLELVIEIEEAFNIEIPTRTAQTLLTVQQAIDYISQKVQFLEHEEKSKSKALEYF